MREEPMLEELRPLTIGDAAKRLGVDLFEVIRLLVASGAPPEHLQLSREQVDALRVLGGIEGPWWGGVELPEDEHPLRQRVRAAVHQLLTREHVGGNATRMDNVWRGLPDDDQAFLQQALATLGEEGVLTLAPTRTGLKVAIAADRVDTARAIADGTHDTPGLTALYQE